MSPPQALVSLRPAWPLVAIALLLQACSGLRPEPPAEAEREVTIVEERDRGPRVPPDLRHVREPTVRDEPRSRWGNPPSYTVFGRTYHVMEQGAGHVETGIASWYGEKFHGRRTSSGEVYDMYALTAAHRHLPVPIVARVTNLENGRSVLVRINDRGPFVGDRAIDLSYAAAYRLGMVDQGTARVRIEALSRNLDAAPGSGQRIASSEPDGDWHLQAAAFRERQNAEALLGRLNRLQLGEARIHSGDEEGLHRVWIGPFPSRGDAEVRQRQLLAHGLGRGHLVRPQ
jgi:rare lipoprotein A